MLFVDSRRRSVQRQDRNADGSWTLVDQSEGDVAVLDARIPMDEIYADVTFEEKPLP